MFFQLRQKEFCSIGPWSIPLTTWRSLSGEIIDKMKFPKNFRVSLSNLSLPASDVIGWVQHGADVVVHVAAAHHD